MSVNSIPIPVCPHPDLHPGMQGIERVAVVRSVDDSRPRLLITFARPLTPQQQVYALNARHYSLTGGQRIFPRVVSATLSNPADAPGDMRGRLVELVLDRAGDSSLYTLTVSGEDVDPFFAGAKIRFDVDRDAVFDCRISPAAAFAPPNQSVQIDYLAKDYASFRQALLDFIPTRLPMWVERSEADIGMMLLELFAATADTLSYMQDRVASEAFLSTATQRRSLAGHLALVGYEIDDGAAAYTWLCCELVDPQAVVALPANPGLRVSNEPSGPDDAIIVFETVQEATLRGEHNAMPIYDWGNADCCLPRTALSVALQGAYKNLNPGDYLLFSDGQGQADIVRLTAAPEIITPTPRQATSQAGAAAQGPQDVTVVRWSAATPLTFDYGLSDTTVRGNLVLATHGETVRGEVLSGPLATAAARATGRPPRLRLTLSQAPLTRLDRGTPALPAQDMARAATAGRFASQPARAISTLQLTVDGEPWAEQASLLNSGPSDPVFRLELDERGYGTVVFGDGVFGRRPADGAMIVATYRIGAGAGGNVGAGTLTRGLPRPGEAAIWAQLKGITNPLSATGGRDQESDDYARRFGPPSTLQPLAAVTPSGYRSALLGYVDAGGGTPVRHARAAYNWSGSWPVVSLQVEQRPGRGLSPSLRDALLAFLETRRPAGYRLEMAAPAYLPVDLSIAVRLAANTRADAVLRALQQALSSAELPDGTKGFFHPDNFDFGDNLYVSKLYAAILAVPGVATAEVTRLARAGAPHSETETRENLRQGYLHAERDQIIILENDRDVPLNGILIIRLKGAE